MADLRVFTDTFWVRRTVWHVYDLVLPVPVPVISACAAMAVLFVEWRFGLMGLLDRLPFPINVLGLLVLPAIAWKLSDRPSIEGRSLQAWVWSQIRYRLEPRQLTGDLEPVREPRRTRASITAWSRRP